MRVVRYLYCVTPQYPERIRGAHHLMCTTPVYHRRMWSRGPALAVIRLCYSPVDLGLERKNSGKMRVVQYPYCVTPQYPERIRGAHHLVCTMPVDHQRMWNSGSALFGPPASLFSGGPLAGKQKRERWE